MASPSVTHRGWWRDIANGRLVAVYNGSQEFAFNTSALFPVTTDGNALGTTALGWSDLHLATGGVINWANGEVTLTETPNALTMDGGDLAIASGFGLLTGSGTQVTISNGDGSTDLIPELQALGVGTAFAGGALLVATFNTTNDRTVSPKIALVKGAAATQVATTAVADNEVVGSIIAYASDSGDFETPVGAIEFVVDDAGGPGASAIGGSIEFYTTADGGSTLTLVMTINSNQNIYVQDTNGVVIGHTAQLLVSSRVAGSVTPEFQVIGAGTGTQHDSKMLLFSGTTADDESAELILVKSGNSTAGSFTILANNEDVGGLIFAGDDGVDYRTPVAGIYVQMDGTPGADDMPGRLIFATTADGANTLTERLRIASTGLVTIAAGTTPAAVGTTPGTASAGALTVTGGLGGNTTIGTTGVGGIGGGFSLTGGAGGTANSATTNATGGAGGAYALTTGAGGATAVAGVTSTGGAGGAVTLRTGDGGAVSLAVSGTATGGAAGALSLTTGTGGAVTATTGTNVGGASGAVTLASGTGGAASGATDTGGASGAVTIATGTGGAGDTGGASGVLTLQTGAAGAGGSPAVGGILFSPGTNEKWRMDSVGNLTSGGANPTNVTADGAIIATGGIAFTDVLNAWIDDATNGNGTTTMYIGNNTINVTAPSDARLKEDLVPYSGSVMEAIRAMAFKTFRFKEGDTAQHFGMTAQDMLDVLPEYVMERSDGYLQIEYHKLMPLVLRGLQELKNENDSLQKRIAALSN